MSSLSPPEIPANLLTKVSHTMRLGAEGKFGDGKSVSGIKLESLVSNARKKSELCRKDMTQSLNELASNGGSAFKTDDYYYFGSLLSNDAIVAASDYVTARKDQPYDRIPEEPGQLLGLQKGEKVTLDGLRDRLEIKGSGEVIQEALRTKPNARVIYCDSLQRVSGRLKQMAEKEKISLKQGDLAVVYQICEEQMRQVIDADFVVRTAAGKLADPGLDPSDRLTANLLLQEAAARYAAQVAMIESTYAAVSKPPGRWDALFRRLGRKEEPVIPGVNLPSSEEIAKMKTDFLSGGDSRKIRQENLFKALVAGHDGKPGLRPVDS